MSNKEVLQKVQQFAFAHRPTVGGFPFLADVLMKAGVVKNIWQLPARQSIYIFREGPVVVQQGTPLLSGMCEVVPFNESKLIAVLRADQVGKTTFPEFLQGAWDAGVISYEVDFDKRRVTYYGAQGEEYTEEYPLIESEWGG